jgi:hypothetical protein
LSVEFPALGPGEIGLPDLPLVERVSVFVGSRVPHILVSDASPFLVVDLFTDEGVVAVIPLLPGLYWVSGRAVGGEGDSAGHCCLLVLDHYEDNMKSHGCVVQVLYDFQKKQEDTKFCTWPP